MLRKTNQTCHEKENIRHAAASTSNSHPQPVKNVRRTEYVNQKTCNDVSAGGFNPDKCFAAKDEKKSKTLHDSTAHTINSLNEANVDNQKKHNKNQLEDDKMISVKQVHVFGKREEGWKEVGRKYSVQSGSVQSGSNSAQQQLQSQPQQQSSSNTSIPEIGCKKIQVPVNAISRVIGRGGSNINAIRAATGAHIEVEKQGKTQGDRSITIKGVAEATKQAHFLISALVKDPEADILSMLPRNNMSPANKPQIVSTSTIASTPSNVATVSEKQTITAVSSTMTFTATTTTTTSSTPIANTSFGATPSKSISSSVPSKQSSSIQTPSKTTKSSAARSLHSLFRIASANKNSSRIVSSDASNKANPGNISSLPSKNVLKSPPTGFGSSSTANTNIDKLNNAIKHAPTFVVITTASSSGHNTSLNSKFSSAFDRKNDSTMTSKSSTSHPSSAVLNEPRPSYYQSPIKSNPIGSLPATFKSDGPGNSNMFRNSPGSKPSAIASKFNDSDSASSSNTTSVTTNARSVTPIGPPTKNLTALPPSNIVNVLDLSTSNRNQIPNQDLAILQAKFNELAMSNKANHEYQLFNSNYVEKWAQSKTPNIFNPLKINPLEMEPPLQVDASKAPGYRGSGGNSMNSPVSSISSTNSATSPSNVLANPVGSNSGGNNANSKMQSTQMKIGQHQKSQLASSNSIIQPPQSLLNRSQMSTSGKPPIDQQHKKIPDHLNGKQENVQQEKKQLAHGQENDEQMQLTVESKKDKLPLEDQAEQHIQQQHSHHQEHQTQRQLHQAKQKQQPQPQFGQSLSGFGESDLSINEMMNPTNQRVGNIGSHQQINRDVNQFMRAFEPISNSAISQNMMQYGGDASSAHSFNVPPQNPTISRLNPKATSFLSSNNNNNNNNNQSKANSPPQQNQFGGNFHQANSNNMNMMKNIPGVGHSSFYNPQQSSNNRQSQQSMQGASRCLYPDFPPANETMDQCMINLGSPTIASGNQQNVIQTTPNLSGSLTTSSLQQNPIQEDRKMIPRPIGTERNSVNKNWMYPYGGTSNVGTDVDMMGGNASSVQQPWFDKNNVQQWNFPGPYPPFDQPPIDRNYQDFFPVRFFDIFFISMCDS